VGVSVAAQSVVAVRRAFRQHAATKVGVLVRWPASEKVIPHAGDGSSSFLGITLVLQQDRSVRDTRSVRFSPFRPIHPTSMQRAAAAQLWGLMIES
jgi:hypothetical protein